MGAREAEKGVLKLVHPGRHVEIHKEPIVAAEVLKKNPRHSVTRPDVFEYPWIVVRPESLLNLGRVFYIVPNRTIYKLIKAKGFCIQPSLRQHLSTKNYELRHLVERTSPSNSSAGTTPKHKGHCQSHWQQFQATNWDKASPQDDSTHVVSFADMVTKYQSSYTEYKQVSVTDSMWDIESPGDKQYHVSEISSSKEAALRLNHDALGTECKQLVTILKPCLRKQDSARKLLQLKVTFFLPTKFEERKRKATDPGTEYTQFLTC
ncbi:hypothetical protein COLO4_04560 [Corchorus olitorius]|uniref:Phototropic-responsive NPH3 family protein n=1 Tax=Corchorus olitorius TaxID=93759 RepID=A0A1R3KTG5_9ROSI|nr:hypothetical protein COLO4_04560 [Corchorus olitorius]